MRNADGLGSMRLAGEEKGHRAWLARKSIRNSVWSAWSMGNPVGWLGAYAVKACHTEHRLPRTTVVDHRPLLSPVKEHKPGDKMPRYSSHTREHLILF